jgi:hypothetical protein
MENGNSNSAHGDNIRISWPETVSEQVISYNIDEAERPAGLKVRFKIKIVTGKQAALADERQAEAIRELLKWVTEYRARPGSR